MEVWLQHKLENLKELTITERKADDSTQVQAYLGP